MEYLIIAIIVVVGWVIYKKKSNKEPKQIEKNTTFQSPPVQHRPVTLENKKNNYLDKKYPPLDEQIGVDHCDGFQCNPNDECTNAEIIFCHTILEQADIPSNRIFGQFPFHIPTTNPGVERIDSGIGRIDFAIKAPDGRALAIELDGYDSHVKMKRKEFDNHQQRQNALVAAGWTVLRFTANQMREDKEYCINFIKKAYFTSERTDSLLTSSTIFADYNTEEAKNASPRKALFSTKRDTYYTICTSANDFNDDHKAQITFWIRCFERGCNGKAIRLKQKKHDIFYWSCNECRKTYSETNNNGIPVG